MSGTSYGWEVATAPQDPASSLDYPFDVSSMVLSVTGTVIDAINQVSATITPSGTGEMQIAGGPGGQSLYLIGNTLTVWLQGGVPGRGSYLLYFTITTTGGRVYGREVTVPMSNVLAATPVPEPLSTGPSAPVVWTA